MTGVQLIGKKAVISRFEKLDCEAWALYQGKQFIVGGVGSDSLNDWLTDFEGSGSTATYTLRIYDCDIAPNSSQAMTEYVSCFQFKVTDQYEGYGIAGHSNRLNDRITSIETELKKLNRPPEDDENETGMIGAVISDWLTNPEKLAVIVGVVKQIFQGGPVVQPAMVATAPLQTISGFRMNTETVSAASHEGLQRISVALDILGQCDPDIVVHLEKLAKLAQEEPLLFKGIISKLDGL